jgi:hypothetical protein
MICSGEVIMVKGEVAKQEKDLFLSEPGIYLVPNSNTSLTNVDIISFKRRMSPEMVRGSLHPEHWLLFIGRGEHSKSRPGVDLTVGIEDTSSLQSNE